MVLTAAAVHPCPHPTMLSTADVVAVTVGAWVNIGTESVSFADAGETAVYQYTVSSWLKGLLNKLPR